MKQSLFFIYVILFSFSTNATVYTVSNDPAKPAQYTSPGTALGAASPGDTLYIYGSPNSYGDFYINKDITIIGAGFNTRKDAFYKTVFRFIFLYGPNRDGVVVDGVMCQVFYINSALAVFNNITLRNMIVFDELRGDGSGVVACGTIFSNWLIENSYIQSYSEPVNVACNPLTPITNGFLIKNSILVSLSRSYNTTFVNCHFGAEGGGSTSFSNQMSNTYNNCIFYKVYFTQHSFNVNNQFNNCLTYLTQEPSATFDLNSWSGGASGTANNCIINQNPLWFTVLNSTMYSNNSPAIRNGWNPAIQVGSPAINAGTDGTDIGLTGNPVPYNVSAEPKIPVIRKYQLVNAVVPPSGTVTVNATATKAQ